MKANLSRVLRSGVALLLVFCMVAGFVPTMAFATEADKINYVSIGDSMANGYGFVGYNQTSNDRDAYDIMTGEGMYGVDAYPIQFENYLANLGYDVNHTKLATSAMLAEDLLYLLGGREYFDDGWRGYKDYVGTYTDAELQTHFQKSVKEADVITIGIGNAAFGAFLMHKLTDALGVFGASLDEDEKVDFEDAIAVLELDAEQYALVMQAYSMLEAELVENVPVELAEQYNLADVADLMAYTLASYIVNYKLLIEQILEMNDDVEIVLVGLLNTTYGMNVTDKNGNVLLPFGDVMDSLFDILNAYMAGLPAVLQLQGVAEDAKLYYAEQPNPQFICQEFENLLNNDWTSADSRLDGATIRQRNIDAFNGDLAPMIGMAVIGEPLTKITLADVQVYEALDFEELKAQVEGQGLGAYWSPWAAFFFSGYINDQQKATDTILSVSIYLAIEEAVAKSTNTMDIPLSGLTKIAGNLSSVFSDLGVPPQDAPESTRKWLLAGLSTEETQGMCKIYGLFKVGNGMSVHPTPAGHDNIAASVIAAYRNNTVKDETIKNVEIVLDELYNLMKEYGPDAAKQVWAQWEAQGYVAAVESSINNVINVAKFRYAYYTESVLPAIDAAIADLNAEKDALVVELTTLNALLAAKEAELADVLAKQEIGSVTVPEINFDITAEVGGNTPSTVPGYDCEAGEGAVAELNAAIADLKHAIAVVEALIADAGADVADMAALAAQIATAIAPLGETVEEIVAAGEDLLEAFWAIREVLTNDSAAKTVETVVSVFNSARSTALAAAKVVELTGTAASLAFDDIDAMVDMVIADAEALAAKIIADIPASLANAPEEVLAAVAVAKIVADIARSTAGDYVGDTVDVKIDALIAEATAKYEAGKADLEAHIIEKSAVVEGILAQLDAHVAAKFPGVKAEAEKQFAALIVMKADLEAELQALKADLEAKVIALANETEATIEAAVAPIKAQIARVEKDLATIENDLACAVEHLAAAKEALVIYVNELVISVNDQVKNTISGVVTEMKETVIAMGENALADLVDMAVAGINKLLMQATTTDLVVDDDFTYVALGDGSAAADSYVELLAALLGEGALANGVDAIDFVNAAKTGNTVIGVRENLPAEIATADLITLGFSNVNFLANAIINVGTERDWAKLVGEENVPYVMELLAEVEAKVAEAGLSGDMAATVNSIIEGFAYCNVEYAVELPKLISNIKAVNPDAVIVIVGMYNPLKDATLVVEGATIEISEYIDYLVEGTAIHGLVYSLISGDSIYVNVGDVATLNTKTELGMADLLSLVATGFAPLNPSAVGDDYIAAEIADALNITYVKSKVEVLLGDVNGDGVVDAKDVTRLRKYMADPDTTEINFKNADVNLDGVVDAKDMTRMRKHFADGVAFG